MTQTIVRLSQAADGEERWLVRYTWATSGTATDFALQDAMVLKTTAGLSFTAASAVNKWLSYVNAGTVSNSTFDIVLNANNQGWQESDYLNGSSQVGSPIAWSLADGSLVLRTYWVGNGETSTCLTGTDCYVDRERTWTNLAVPGTKVFVMEHLFYPNSLDQYRINRYVATTAAMAQSASKAKAASYQVFTLPGKGK